MFIAPLLVFVVGQSGHGSIQLVHTRPSRMLQKMREFYFSQDFPWPFRGADDAKGLLYVGGSEEQMQEAKAIVREFDVARRKVVITASIDSEIDKLDYEVTGKLLNQQSWTTFDADTKLSLTFVPRINADNTITVALTEKIDNETMPTIVFRLKNNEKLEISKLLAGQKSVAPSLPEPNITLKAQVVDQ